MKTYIFKIESKGAIYTTSIYRVKNNIPELIGSLKYSSGSYRGHIHEVFGWLVENKHIPAKYYGLSVEPCRGLGYYCKKVKEKGIQIIEL